MTPVELAQIISELIAELRAHTVEMQRHHATLKRIADALEREDE